MIMKHPKAVQKLRKSPMRNHVQLQHSITLVTPNGSFPYPSQDTTKNFMKTKHTKIERHTCAVSEMMKSSGSSASWSSKYSVFAISCSNCDAQLSWTRLIKKFYTFNSTTETNNLTSERQTCIWNTVSNCISMRKTLRQSIASFL